MAGTEKAQIVIDTSVNQKGLQDGLKKSNQAVKDFAKGVIKELAGMDQILSAMGQGPAALGKLAVDIGKKAVAALNEMAAQYRVQEQAEAALQNAAKNNPYLNERSVNQLKAYANEMQRVTGISSDQILQTETRLASLGRNQEQIMKITKAAADMAASGVMDYDSAVQELSNSLNGVVRTSGRLYPELKKLSKEALASGEAIDVIAGKVAGSAAEAMKTGAGSVKAYENAVGDLKKLYGENWEGVTRGFRDTLTKYIERVAEAKKTTMDFKRAIEALKEGTGTIDDDINALSGSLALSTDEATKWVNRLEGAGLVILKSLGGVPRLLIESATTGTTDALKKMNPVELYKPLIDAIKETTGLTEEEIKKINDQIAVLVQARNIQQQIAEIVKITETASEMAVSVENQERYNKALKVQEKIDAQILELREAIKANKDYAVDYSIAAELDGLKEIAEQEIKIAEQNQKIAGFREEYEKKLKEQTDWIKKQAEFRGEDVNSLSVQNQLLDAQISAYKGLIDASEGLITNELSIEDAIKKAHKALTERAQTEKYTDEERKKRLAEISKAQEDAARKLETIYGEIQKEVDRQAELADERDHQEQLLEIRKKSILEILGFNNESVRKELEFEKQTRTDHAKELFDIQKAGIDRNHAELLQKNEELYQAEKEKYKGNADILKQIDDQYQLDKEENEKEYVEAVKQMELNLKVEITNIDRDTNEALKKADDDLLRHRLKNVESFLNAASQMARGISSIQHSIIDNELNEKLIANDKIIQSDEERARAEKKLQIEAAYKRYEADMNAYVANVIMAPAQAALGVLTALAQSGWPGAIAAGVLGTVNVAAVIAAKPQRPRFAEGGIVPGSSYSGDKVPVMANSGEVISTQKQFGNIMKGFENLANMKGGGGQPQMNVQVINNASNMVSTSQSIDPDGLKIVIEQVVGNALGSGRLDNALTMRQGNAAGEIIT